MPIIIFWLTMQCHLVCRWEEYYILRALFTPTHMHWKPMWQKVNRCSFCLCYREKWGLLLPINNLNLETAFGIWTFILTKGQQKYLGTEIYVCKIHCFMQILFPHYYSSFYSLSHIFLPTEFLTSHKESGRAKSLKAFLKNLCLRWFHYLIFLGGKVWFHY